MRAKTISIWASTTVLGGKLEPMEDIAAGMQREIREEAHIECLSMQLRGTLNWPGFGKNGEDWLGFIFLIDRFEGVVPPVQCRGRSGVGGA
jgi:8-oxo-dGTP pyrophosphatase MutT (NUDIX family)